MNLLEENIVGPVDDLSGATYMVQPKVIECPNCGWEHFFGGDANLMREKYSSCPECMVAVRITWLQNIRSVPRRSRLRVINELSKHRKRIAGRTSFSLTTEDVG